MEALEGTYEGILSDELQLSEKEQQQVQEFAKRIDVQNDRMVNSYCADVQKKVATLTTVVSDAVNSQDYADIGGDLKELCDALNWAVLPGKKGIFGFLGKRKNKASEAINNYECANERIKQIENNLRQHQKLLMKDIQIFEQMYHTNLGFYRELSMYIMAGKQALSSLRSTKLYERRENTENSGDLLALQAYRDYEESCNRFEKKISDLETTRLISMQMAAQIRLLQNADQQVVDKLNQDVLHTIPLWRNQMALSMGLAHMTAAMEAQDSVDRTTKKILRRNTENIKKSAVDAAIASQKEFVDVEELKKANDSMIASVDEVVRIHGEGTKRRVEVQEEFIKMKDELKKMTEMHQS